MRRRSQTVEGILEILNTVGRGAHALLDRAEFFLRMFLSDEGNIVTLGSTIATIAGVIYWSIFPDYSMVTIIVVVISCIFLVASWTRSIIKFDEFTIIDDMTTYLAAIELIAKSKADGVKIITRNENLDPIFCYNIQTQLLNQISNTIELLPARFSIDTSIILKPSKIIGFNNLFTMTNDFKVRLATEFNAALVGNSRIPIQLQKTEYYFDRCTNNIATKAIMLSNFIVKSCSDFMMDDGRLSPLDKTEILSNHLGGSTILVTQDPYLVYVLQGRKTDENATKLAPTGSGSFDWRDMDEKNGTPFLSFVTSEIERELIEEVGVPNRTKMVTYLVGFTRYLYRNGKPEFMAITLADLSFSALEVRYSERRFINKRLKSFSVSGTKKSHVLDALNSFERALKNGKLKSGEKIGTASSPLLANVYLAKRFLTEDIRLKQDDFVSSFFEDRS